MRRLFAEPGPAGAASPVELAQTTTPTVLGATVEIGPFRFTERGGVEYQGIERELSPDLMLHSGEYELTTEREWVHLQRLSSDEPRPIHAERNGRRPTGEVVCLRMRADGCWEKIDHTPPVPKLPTAEAETVEVANAVYSSLWEQVKTPYPIGDAMVSGDYIMVAPLAFPTSKPFDHTDPRTNIRYRLRTVEGFPIFTVTGGTSRADFFLEGRVVWRGYRTERAKHFLEKDFSEMTDVERRLAKAFMLLQRFGGPNISLSAAVIVALVFMVPWLLSLAIIGPAALGSVLSAAGFAVLALIVVAHVSRPFPRIPPD